MLQLLAQATTDYTYTTYTTTNTAGAGIFGGVFFFIYFAVLAIMIVSMWKLFVKAGKPGWASIVPIYNVIVMLQICGKPTWWVLLFFVPFVNFVIAILVYIELAKVFGKDAVWGLLLVFLPIIGFPLLAFGDAQYTGPTTPAAA